MTTCYNPDLSVKFRDWAGQPDFIIPIVLPDGNAIAANARTYVRPNFATMPDEIKTFLGAANLTKLQNLMEVGKINGV